MRISLKKLLALVAFAALLCLAATWALRLRAADSWGYGKLGVTDGTPKSAAYYIEVRGIDSRPTITRVVRFADQSKAPINALEISHRVSSELISHTENADRWNRQCVLIAGRSNDEKMMIAIDMEVAKNLFARPGTQLDNHAALEKLWADYVESHLPVDR